MPGPRPETAEAALAAMCSEMERRTVRAPRTIRFYREEVSTIIRVLRAGGRHVLPWEIDEEDVKWLLDRYIEMGLTVSTRRGYISALRTWTKWYDNPVVAEMGIRWPADMRPRVDWLTEDQARRLLDVPMTPQQDLLVHCELCLGMRRIEVMRLTPDSFHDDVGYVEILGKGPQGGKPRTMPYHRDTRRVLDRYMRYRQLTIELVRMARPDAEIPRALMIWGKGSTLREYGKKGSGLDAMLIPLGEQIGAHIGNHTLRRTFGRMMFLSGVEVATISRMMGHETTEQTLKYIGINLDDMAAAMESFRLRAPDEWVLKGFEKRLLNRFHRWINQEGECTNEQRNRKQRMQRQRHRRNQDDNRESHGI